MQSKGGFKDRATVTVGNQKKEPLGWLCRSRVEKYHTGDYPHGRPYETMEHTGNLQLIGGASLFWERAITLAPTTSATGAALQALSTATAVIGVGDNSTAAVGTQEGLKSTGGATGIWYSTMTTGFPSHTDATTSTGGRTTQFKASYGSTQANFAWNEWAVANSSGGRHINRAVASLGTKTTGTWTLTVDLTLTT
jgi:hypothetical protein